MNRPHLGQFILPLSMTGTGTEPQVSDTVRTDTNDAITGTALVRLTAVFASPTPCTSPLSLCDAYRIHHSLICLPVSKRPKQSSLWCPLQYPRRHEGLCRDQPRGFRLQKWMRQVSLVRGPIILPQLRSHANIYSLHGPGLPPGRSVSHFSNYEQHRASHIPYSGT